MRSSVRYVSLKSAAAIVCLILLCNLPEKALGHAFPDHAEPRVGSTVAAPPTQVRIWFDGALEPAFSSLAVLNSSGKKVDRGDSRVNSSDPTLLEVSVLALTPGTYRVIWQVVSRDGHRTMGDHTFTVK